MRNRSKRIKFFLIIAIIENLNMHLANIKKKKNSTFCFCSPVHKREGRVDEFLQAMTDSEVLKKLYQEYGIK